MWSSSTSGGQKWWIPITMELAKEMEEDQDPAKEASISPLFWMSPDKESEEMSTRGYGNRAIIINPKQTGETKTKCKW